MRFESPWLLLLALPAAAAAWRAWRAEEAGRAAISFPGLEDLMEATPAWRTKLVRLLPYALKALVLLLALAALARPQRVMRQIAGTAQGIDIMLILDTSDSMRALDFEPADRMAAAKKAAREFIGKRISDRIGIVVFGGDPVLTCPLTLDYEALASFLEQVHAGMTNVQGTAIGDGLAAAVSHLKDSSAKSRVAVLLTDGRNNAGLVDPVTAARTAKAVGVKVYVVGAARRGEAVLPVDDPVFGRRLVRTHDDLDEDTLLKVAAEADGRYFRAENVKELQDIYAEIDRMEKTDVKMPDTVSYRDLYAWLLLPAALLLAGEMALTRTLLLRIP